MIDEMKKAIFSRYNKHGIKFDTWEELVLKTKINESVLPRCFYCNDLLEVKNKKDNRKIITIAHKIPKFWGGEDTIENTCLCCNECNTIKGTMKSNTFEVFIALLIQNGLKERVFNELFPGNFRKNLFLKNKSQEKSMQKLYFSNKNEIKETKQLWELV